MPPKPGSHPPAFNFSQNPTPESPSGPAEQPPENIREEPMRSNSRNFLLSASASRSDDDHPNGIPGGAAQEQYSYHMGAEHVGMPRGAARQVQPTLGDLYCQVQEKRGPSGHRCKGVPFVSRSRKLLESFSYIKFVPFLINLDLKQRIVVM